MSTVNGAWRGPNIVKDGLVLYLDAGSPNSYYPTTAGTTWKNISTPNSTISGSLTNGAFYTGSDGGAFVFDGVDDYVGTPYDLSWNNTNSVTINMYLRPASLSTVRPFIGKGPLFNDFEWEIAQQTTSLLFVYWDTGGSSTGRTATISNFFTSTGSYVNLSMVWNNVDNNYYFYRNSTLVNTTIWGDASQNQNRANFLRIGGDIYPWNLGGGYWNGNIAQTSIYNRALSASEVLQNYNATRARFGL